MTTLLKSKCLLGLILLVVLAAASSVQAAVPKSQDSSPLFTYDLAPLQNYGLDTKVGKNNVWAESHFVAALQGLANRDYPRLYVYFNTDDNAKPGRIDRFWLDILRQPGGWLAVRKLQPVSSLTDLVAKFRPAFRGVVLYDLSVPATSHVASTIAGCDDLLPVPYDPTPGSVYDRLVVHGPHLPVKMRLLHADGTPLFTGTETGSAKCDAYLWAKRNYLDTGKCSPTVMGYYIDAIYVQYPESVATLTETCSADYLIQHKAFFFDLSPWEDEAPQDDPHQPLGTDNKTLCAILLSAYKQTHGQHMITVTGFPPIGWKYTASHGGHHQDVETEWHFAQVISCFNAFLDSADTPMANASIYCQFPLKARYVQHKPTLADWKKAGYVDASGKIVPHQYVSFYAGDYDSAAWLYTFLPNIWTDKMRGSVPLGWGFNPNLAARFPVGLDWVRRTATPNDLFVCGDSAAGYLNPGELDGPRPYSHLPSGVETWTRFCRYWYGRFDLSLSGFVIDGNSPPMSDATAAGYATFSPDGAAVQNPHQQPALLNSTNVPILGMELYLPYSGDIPAAIASGEGMLKADTGTGPHFHIWRTILMSPTIHMKIMQGLESALPNVKVVDPYTLMGLAKLSISQKAH